jgi:hypothetical protein
VEIFIDGQPLGFTLENERSLQDVLRAVSGWVETQKSRIVALTVNGEPVRFDTGPPWAEVPVEEIKTLHMSTRADLRQTAEDLRIIVEYLSLLESAVDQEEMQSLGQILAEYPYIRGSLAYHAEDLFRSESGIALRLDSLVEHILGAGPESVIPEKNSVIDYLKNLILLLNGRIKEVQDPEKEAAAVARLLSMARRGIENVSVLLQTGKDGEAMQNILSYTELVLKAARLLAFRNSGAAEIEDFCRELNRILEELAGAFSLKDSVLIGDLLEYELAPRTDTIIDFLEKDR